MSRALGIGDILGHVAHPWGDVSKGHMEDEGLLDSWIESSDIANSMSIIFQGHIFSETAHFFSNQFPIKSPENSNRFR